MSAHYWIAQYIADLFRKEPKNVGVLVECRGEKGARFLGETFAGQLDGRKLRTFNHPEVYRQWIDFWRDELEKGTEDLPTRMSGQHYRLVAGGDVTDINSDDVEDITNYLYALLVSEGGGLRQALDPDEEFSVRGRSLEDEIVRALDDERILADSEDLIVPHPVRRGMRIPGETEIEHAPAFVQENGRLYVMEMVDFSTTQKRRSRDHAGWCAYMFRDLVKRQPDNTDPIALVRATPEDQEHEDVDYALALLRTEATIVDWLREDDRQAFLEDRRRIAYAD